MIEEDITRARMTRPGEMFEAVEGPHWAPPEAPLAMPRQVLEAAPRAEGQGAGLLARLFAPLSSV
ncbi:hypothetical protein [Pseudooceanicola sp. 200-1SW]|uniref:hypothetical protein n=1 Tax=Pseudooceanicola sp. 200-1SW TaxID=3425949 RepID=UPI003D7FEC37